MKIKSLSATALETADGCLARFKAENVDRAPSMDNSAAAVGTTCHYALEKLVDECILKKEAEWSLKTLRAYYELGYLDTFGKADFDSAEFADGWELCQNWFKRSDIYNNPNVEVLSVEQKLNFEIKLADDTMLPFNYIFDRLDRLGPGEYRVVDYKTIRAYLTTDGLRRKTQAKAYAVACKLMYPDATRIWVEFDMLRHDIVGVVFTTEEMRAAYRAIRRKAQQIWDTPESDIKETINPGCKWCIRKTTCDTLRRNVDAGSVNGLSSSEAAVRLLQVKQQMEGLKWAETELQNHLLGIAEKEDMLSWDEDGITINVTASRRRVVSNPMAVIRIVGDELAQKYGKIGVGDITKMMKANELTPEQAKQVKELIKPQFGEPTIKVELKSFMEE